MSKVWVGFTLAAVAIVGLTAWAVVRSRAPDLGPAGPNRDLAPDTLAVYAEFPDLAGTWKKMEKTDAWQDLAASKVAERALAASEVKDFLAALDQVSQKAAYPVDAKNAMKFLGRECSVGLALDAAGGAPKLLVLTKLDVEALSKDFLGGKVNLDALWGELQRRTGKCDFTVAATDYRGHKIATATRGDAAFHAALVGDTLAVATDAALVRAAIDCRLNAGAHSIGKKAAFLADVKALPAGTAGFEWYDLDALEAGRASVDAGLTALGVPRQGIAAAHGVLDGTRGAHSVALSQVVPDGDLYRATWTFSKSADLFADKASAPLRDLVPGEWLAYGEVHDLGGVVEAYGRSALRKKLGAGEMGKWLDKVLDDPGPVLGKLVATMTGGAAAHAPRAAAPQGSTPVDAAATFDEELALVDHFAVRMGRHVASEQLQALVNGEIAWGVDWAGRQGEVPRIACAIRLDVEGRLIWLAAQAAAMDAGTGGVAVEQVATRKVFSVDAAQAKVYWVVAGDSFVLSNDHDLVVAAARTGEAPAPARSKKVEDAVAAMKVGWCAFLHVDYDRLSQSLGTASETNPSMRQLTEMIGTYRDLGVMGRDVAVAAYVPDDFGSIEVGAKMWLADPKTDEGRALRASSVSREPLVWSSLPDTTIASVVNYPADVPGLWLLAKSVAGPGMKDMETEFRDRMGMDLEKDLIPALGREFSLAVTFRPAPPPNPAAPGGGAPHLPGFLLGLEVRDTAVVRKAIDRALEIAEESLRSDPGYASTKPFAREAHDGVEVVRMEIPPEQRESVPVRPALALQDGYLLVSTDVDVLRAAVDARNGKGKRFADSALFGRAKKVLQPKCTTFEIVDWPRLVDQVREYAPRMGGIFVADPVPFPQLDAGASQEEWKRAMEEFQRNQAAAAASGGEKAKAWIDSFRVVDFAGVTSRITGKVAESTMFVKFAE